MCPLMSLDPPTVQELCNPSNELTYTFLVQSINNIDVLVGAEWGAQEWINEEIWFYGKSQEKREE